MNINYALKDSLEAQGVVIYDYYQHGDYMIITEYDTGSHMAISNANVADFDSVLEENWFHVSGLYTE